MTETSSTQPAAGPATHYALGAIFLTPLLIGVFLVSTSANRSDQANQVTRDIASMYAQGVDFSKEANQGIALRVAQGVGMKLNEGKGLLILSKIHVVRDIDCGSDPSRPCVNKGYPVVTQRVVIGNARLGASSFGNPGEVDAGGRVRDWATDSTARAREFSADLKPGEFTYAAECFLPGSDMRPGVYSRTMF